MQICRESRAHAPYIRAFISGPDERYIWINFEVDMICIPDHRLLDPILQPHCQDIQRLRLIVGSHESYDYVTYWDPKYIDGFTHLREVHVVVEEVMLLWPSAYLEIYWGVCPKENIRFIDPISGIMLNDEQLSMAHDWHKYYSWDGKGRVQDRSSLDEEIRMGRDVSHLTLPVMRQIE